MKRKLVELQVAHAKQEQQAAESGFSPSSSSTSNKRFTDRVLSDLMFLEIFSGTARLSKAVKQAGVSVLPIDKTTSRSSGIYIATYDLSDESQVELLLEMVTREHNKIIAIHMAPACGTASRAREKPLTSWQRKGFKVPKPLRTEEHILGVPGLQGTDKIRTESANLVYSMTARILRHSHGLGIPVSIENPANSLFWLFPDILQAMVDIGGSHVTFHNCMHGGSRDKLTKWWTTTNLYDDLQIYCDKSHAHAKWNPTIVDGRLQFPTADEAAYPELLCTRVAHILTQYCLAQGAVTTHTLVAQVQQQQTTSHRWLLGLLPKGKKAKPLVDEFSDYFQCVCPPHVDPVSLPCVKQHPKGTRLVHRHLKRGIARVGHNEDGPNVFLWKTIDEGNEDKGQFKPVDWIHGDVPTDKMTLVEISSFGLPRECWDFVDRAIQVGHPRSIAIHLNEAVVQMLNDNFGKSDFDLVKLRAQFLHKWTSRAEELKHEEKKFHDKLSPHVAHVLQGKRLLVLKEMLSFYQYPDKNLVEDIAGGFRLTGWLPKSNVFPAKLKQPERSVEAALSQAQGVNKSIIKQVCNVSDNEIATETWALTQEELDKGWVWEDVDCDPSKHLLAKRFGLRQGSKTRLIDDCSVGGFNSTCGSSERLRIHAIDEMTAYLAWCMQNLESELTGNLVGRTYDLKSAYKQFAVADKDRDLLRIAVWDNAKGRVVFLGVNSLPFGAIGSVSAFLRVAMAAWFLGVVGLKLCWSCFYDDYTLISKKETSASAGLAAEFLFDLLGFRYAKEGTKATPFAEKFKTLGVSVNLAPERRHDESFKFEIGHTETRILELTEFLDLFISKRRMSKKEAERLRGRLQFFETYAHGRVAHRAMSLISEVATGEQPSRSLSDRTMDAMFFLRDRVLTAPPVEIHKSSLESIVVFTDGSCEGETDKQGGVGGVVFHHAIPHPLFYSEQVPAKIMQMFLRDSSHPIYELELLPILICILTWRREFSHNQVVFYLDNEAAKAALINGVSKTAMGMRLVKAVTSLEVECQMKVWFCRVPTSSNPSDGPSRFDCSEIVAKGGKHFKVDWSEVTKTLEEEG